MARTIARKKQKLLSPEILTGVLLVGINSWFMSRWIKNGGGAMEATSRTPAALRASRSTSS